MWVDALFIALGVVGLYYGGHYLVKGSVALSLHYGISPMIVGLTVMAFGTSAPELFVSIRSAMSGHGDIAFGNIVGSNIANILLILGVPAIISPVRTDLVNSRLPWMETMFAVLLFWALVQFKPFTSWQGLILLACFALVLFMQIRRALKGQATQPADVDESTKDEPLWRIFLWILLGVVLLPLSGEVLVRGAVDIARALNVSEAIIGLTIVAIGTSLPELAASITAAGRGETAMAIGNVLGSCLFNILLVIGMTGVLSTTWIDDALIRYDIPVLVLVTALMAIVVFWKRPISRPAGIVMVLAYLAYLMGVVF